MTYKLEYSKKCLKQLVKLDDYNVKIILSWLNKNVSNCNNYKEVNSYKELTGNYRGFFRYRVGNYRIICEIKDNELVIIAVLIGHRKDIYK